MGEITRRETARLTSEREGDAAARHERALVRTGNFRLTQRHFHWVDLAEVERRDRPEWALVLERLEWGRFYGFPEAFVRLVAYVPTSGRAPAEVLAELRRRVADFQPSQPGAKAGVVLAQGERWRLATLQEAEAPGARVVGVAEVLEGPAATWEAYLATHENVRARCRERRRLERVDTGRINRRQEEARLRLREHELAVERLRGAVPAGDPRLAAAEDALREARAAFERVQGETEAAFAEVRTRIQHLRRENDRFRLLLRTAGEDRAPPQLALLRVADVVRAYPANRLSLGQRLGVYFSRWGEFLTDEPREANSEGGVYPALFGTVLMTLIMSVVVVPFGVLAALYMREYARKGLLLSAVRIAVNNLAGVPSIVFGVFGLGFFCYAVGSTVDQLFFAASLPNPTFGKGGILWASLTLALLTLPVVIVATEEALSAVPGSLRQASYACGATKWQTIRRVVLPQAMPGIITGAILAMARGAGEVAPLMLVGAVKLAPELPLDGEFPFFHPQRSFMHLGFHIYDVGFQSQNSEAAKPMVFTTTLLLIATVAALNLCAIALRSRLQKRFKSSKF
ncbi:MAG: phosphate ABC transporter permease PstA [Planctomycetota bacterium]|nr:MAG: phosphate ABC transporter permease PstA [Planctomycetota bacterium]